MGICIYDDVIYRSNGMETNLRDLSQWNKETHIVGAIYRDSREKDLVLRCDKPKLRGYTWVTTNTPSRADRCHEFLMEEGTWIVELPKEYLFDKLYLILKSS